MSKLTVTSCLFCTITIFHCKS